MMGLDSRAAVAYTGDIEEEFGAKMQFNGHCNPETLEAMGALAAAIGHGLTRGPTA